MKKRIWIFRHGQTDWNLEGRFQGHVDIPLNETGRAQARALVEDLQAQSIEAVLSSDLARAVETGKIVAESLGIPLYHDEGLREAHLGGAQGLTREEIERLFGVELLLRWKSRDATDADVSYPGGETGTEVVGRSLATLERFLLTQPFQRIGVASHGGVIRRIMHRILPPDSDPVPIPNGVIYALEYETDSRDWSIP